MTLEGETHVLDILKIDPVKSLHGNNCLLTCASDGCEFLRHNPVSGLKMGPFLRMWKGLKATYLIPHLLNLVQKSINQ